MKQQERIHSGEKTCNKDFSRSSTLKYHERIHTGENGSLSINNDYYEQEQTDKSESNKEILMSASSTVVLKVEKLNEEEILFIKCKEYFSNSSSYQDMVSFHDKKTVMNSFNAFKPENGVFIKCEQLDEGEIQFIEGKYDNQTPVTTEI